MNEKGGSLCYMRVHLKMYKGGSVLQVPLTDLRNVIAFTLHVAVRGKNVYSTL